MFFGMDILPLGKRKLTNPFYKILTDPLFTDDNTFPQSKGNICQPAKKFHDNLAIEMNYDPYIYQYIGKVVTAVLTEGNIFVTRKLILP